MTGNPVKSGRTGQDSETVRIVQKVKQLSLAAPSLTKKQQRETWESRKEGCL